MKTILRRVLAIVILALGSQLAACGNSNPYIGTWEGTIEIQNPMLQLGMALTNELSGKKNGSNTSPVTLIFTETELVVFSGSTENRTPITYRKDDTGYAFKNIDDKIWERATFKDKNTMQMVAPQGITFNLKRTK